MFLIGSGVQKIAYWIAVCLQVGIEFSIQPLITHDQNPNSMWKCLEIKLLEEISQM